MATEADDHVDDPILALVSALESARQSGTADQKIAALKAVREAINPVDDSYLVQKDLATEGAVEAVVGMLGEGDEAVAVEAAGAVGALVAHSETVSVRLRHGREVGYGGRPDQVSFNPVQGTLEEVQGVRKLVDLLFGQSASAKDAAYDALMSACSYNHENKLAFLRALLGRLLDGRAEALEFLDTLMAGLEMTDDVAVVLDQALMPVLKIAKAAEGREKVDAVVLLGTICEERPAASAFLVGEGLLQPLAQMIITGDTRARDAAVHTMFQVIRKNKRVLGRGEEVLGVKGSSLVDPLIQIVQAPAPAEGQEDGNPKGFDSSDEAALVLKALAEQDPASREQVEEWKRTRPQGLDPEPGRCPIM
ncbi:unnamed protein product [Ostreobium quekettii]|uniref:Uncharacterized protein n=1 Tax=Ostreobium quekettii TaxID=121088 RepID=A0A8S1J7L9_9CHLO|nr:unnamed protein product [Ostreobium quekettii]|eukprot:evm.model.scf_379.1 EVM.evm.TU.scf_379.1   scf_379:6155-11550(-)